MLHKDNGMKCKFIITRMGKIGEKDIAYGDFYIISGDKLLDKFAAQSGGYGKGELPTGEYMIDWFITPEDMATRKTKDAYTLFNFGWAFNMKPLFSTDRTELMLHPDGNVPGSLGCIVFPFKSITENESCYKLLAGGMALYKRIPCYVEKVLNQRFSWELGK
jgi:hypothetical protein